MCVHVFMHICVIDVYPCMHMYVCLCTYVVCVCARIEVYQSSLLLYSCFCFSHRRLYCHEENVENVLVTSLLEAAFEVAV